MKLLVLSHTPHYLRGQKIVGFGPTVRELDHLARLFSRVVHLAPLYPGPAPASALPYRSGTLLRPLVPTGGESLPAKLGILARAPAFYALLRRELAAAEVWHVRAPANVALLAMLAFDFLPSRPCWIKYAGNWRPEGPEARSYTWQRKWLERPRHNLAVTVNGHWPNAPDHIFSFRNPSFENEELAAAGQGKRRLPAAGETLELLFVGRLDEAKGASRCIDILDLLRQRGIAARLELVGGGQESASLALQARAQGLQDQVALRGELPRPALAELYARAHFLLLPSYSSEGWPKVLSEAMAYGTLPLAGAVSSIPEGLQRAGAGRALPPLDVASFAATLGSYLEQPERFAEESLRAREAAADFTYDRHLAAVRELFEHRWKIQLLP